MMNKQIDLCCNITVFLCSAVMRTNENNVKIKNPNGLKSRLCFLCAKYISFLGWNVSLFIGISA